MKNFLTNLTKTDITAIIGILWTIACLYVYCGFAKSISDGQAEKMYSIEMIIIGYYFRERLTKNNSNKPQS